MLTFNELGRYGRLGNQMFQIASTIGIATRHGYEFGFPAWKNYDAKERFNSKEDIDIQQYFKNPLPLCEKKERVHFVDWGYHRLNLEDNISLAGHLQSEKYFLHCKDLVRHYFELKEQKVRINDKFCSVHIRLGDYDNNYHPRLGLEYYLKAFEIMRKKRVNQFFVFSDEADKAFELFRYREIKEGEITIVPTGTTFEDFNTMVGFQNHIIGNSTFSWWAAWLSNCPPQNVIAPRNWFGEVANLSSEDIYCEGWTVL
jgi:hypothetical protein